MTYFTFTFDLIYYCNIGPCTGPLPCVTFTFVSHTSFIMHLWLCLGWKCLGCRSDRTHAHTHTHIAGRSMFVVYPLLLRLGGLGGEHAPRAWKTQHREENRKTSTFANNQTRFHHVTSPSWGRSLCLFIHLGTAPKKTRSFNLWQTHPSLLLWMLASLSVSVLVYHHRTIGELGASTPPGSSCRNV